MNNAGHTLSACERGHEYVDAREESQYEDSNLCGRFNEYSAGQALAGRGA